MACQITLEAAKSRLWPSNLCCCVRLCVVAGMLSHFRGGFLEFAVGSVQFCVNLCCCVRKSSSCATPPPHFLAVFGLESAFLGGVFRIGRFWTPLLRNLPFFGGGLAQILPKVGGRQPNHTHRRPPDLQNSIKTSLFVNFPC